ncbi:hypothetical protein N7499_005928 [Penicillium canescens]|uniref:Uncharacterized protein n=1 Tax=Penicillium canescens TaxID=5083 RepID=A0AAD6ICU2_PENCN|nr:hypothetical protein N7460_004856 [Penicillium canescens]KAJ6081054.1 hypothetical protein N7499_005928 [Penicillium canescens]KAJ6177150.1 hypothetical protein N7485_004064 [Penicillium canescens]
MPSVLLRLESVCSGFVESKAFTTYKSGGTRGPVLKLPLASQERGDFENSARSRAAVLITGVGSGALLKRYVA